MADPLQVLRETPVEELRQSARSKEKRQVLREFIPRYLERKATKREIWAFMDADMWIPEDPEDVSSWGGNSSELEQFSQHLHRLPPSVTGTLIAEEGGRRRRRSTRKLRKSRKYSRRR